MNFLWNILPNRWTKYVLEEDRSINNTIMEIATFTQTKNGIRVSDISLEGSRNHKSFDENLISKARMENNKKIKFDLPVSYVLD